MPMYLREGQHTIVRAMLLDMVSHILQNRISNRVKGLPCLHLHHSPAF